MGKNEKQPDIDITLYEDTGIDFLGLGRLFQLKQTNSKDNNKTNERKEDNIQAVSKGD